MDGALVEIVIFVVVGAFVGDLDFFVGLEVGLRVSPVFDGLPVGETVNLVGPKVGARVEGGCVAKVGEREGSVGEVVGDQVPSVLVGPNVGALVIAVGFDVGEIVRRVGLRVFLVGGGVLCFLVGARDGDFVDLVGEELGERVSPSKVGAMLGE